MSSALNLITWDCGLTPSTLDGRATAATGAFPVVGLNNPQFGDRLRGKAAPPDLFFSPECDFAGYL